MFCPSCKDEFRPGFTRCANCDVELVDDLAQAAARPTSDRVPPQITVQVAEYCGFLDLNEAREARELLRGHGVHSDIVIRDAPGSGGTGPVEEEFWLRVDRKQYARVPSILGFDSAEPESHEEATTTCDACGTVVAADETFCPKCGARFEES